MSKNKPGFLEHQDISMKKSNRTSTYQDIYDPNNTVYNWFMKNVPNKRLTIMDYGAGIKALYTKKLREEGYKFVVANEWGDNFVNGLHDKESLTRIYEVIIASNVVNVQLYYSPLMHTIAELQRATGEYCLINYPKEPRFMPRIEEWRMLRNIRRFFANTDVLLENEKDILWRCSDKRIIDV